ncbi:serine/threonine-protein kinase [Haliscomenobacter sp.]|uniref:serine/threonine-protein kinase n=1 Tax=Haliscomenobacter sp. TaxID=2717303 RepID=UPI003BAC0D9C
MPLVIIKGESGEYQFNPQSFAVEGGTGKVFKGLVLSSYKPELIVGSFVAIKVMYKDLTSNINNIIRAEDSAKIKLNHPNLMKIYDFIEYKGIFHTISEWLEGVTLEDRIKESIHSHMHLPLAEINIMIKAILDGVEHLHLAAPPVYHRDIKPDNIMLCYNGVIKIMDFGIAKIKDKRKKTNIGVQLGTLEYMPPEQIRGEHEKINATSDIYAIGNTIYEIFCGHPPFQGSEFEIMNKQVSSPILDCGKIPEPFLSLIQKATQKLQKNRFQSISEMREFLEKPSDKRPTLWTKPYLNINSNVLFWTGVSILFSTMIIIIGLPLLAIMKNEDILDVDTLRWQKLIKEANTKLVNGDKEQACKNYIKAYELKRTEKLERIMKRYCNQYGQTKR